MPSLLRTPSKLFRWGVWILMLFGSLCHNIILQLSFTTMSTPNKYCTIPDLDLDCPAIDCEGWLVAFALRSDLSKKPIFLKCSNSLCTQKVMLSKFASRCVVCNKSIKEMEIITQNPVGGPWVHCECYCQATDFFATCQRCKQHISSEEAFICWDHLQRQDRLLPCTLCN